MVFRRSLILIVIGIVLAGCATLEVGFGVLSFKEAPNSGVTKGQEFNVYVIKGEGNTEQLPPAIDAFGSKDEVFKQQLASCRRQETTAFGAVLAPIITKAGQMLIDEAFSTIETKAKQLIARSQKKYEARASWGASAAPWERVKCILLVRTTKAATETASPSVGMLALISRQKVGPKASVLELRHLFLGNAVAITEDGDKPAVAIDIVFVLNQIAAGKLTTVAEIALPQVSPPIGGALPVCRSGADGKSDCRHRSNMFPHPYASTTKSRGRQESISVDALQLAVKVVESGSGVPELEKVQAGTKALRELTKPVFDHVLEKIAAAVKQ